MARMHIRSLALLALIAGTCFTASARFDDPNPLSGPKVKDTGVPGESKSFTNTESKLRYENRMISEKVFKQTIEYMRSTEVDAALRLSDEQMKTVREQDQKLQTQRREYLAKNKETLGKLLADAGVKNADLSSERGIRQAMEKVRNSAEDLRKKEVKKGDAGKKPAAEKGEPGGEDGMMQDSMQPGGEAAKQAAGAKASAIQQLAEIRKNFPKSEDAHAAVWAVMNDKQKEAAQAKLKELMARESEQKMLPGVQDQVQRQLKNKKFQDKSGKKQDEKSEKRERRKLDKKSDSDSEKK